MPDVVPPAHLWVPERRGSYLDEVRDVAVMIGRPLDAEQEIAVDAKTSYGTGGRWLTLETGLKVPRQNGKALDCRTPMLTTVGWKAMGDLVEGDEVFHPGGYPVRVAGAFDAVDGHDCYRVTTTDGRTLVADGDHLWTVVDKRREVCQGLRAARVRHFEIRTVTTRQMLDEGLSRYVFGGRTSVTDGKPYATNEYRFVLPAQEPVKSPDVELPVDPYLLGAWLGDGHSRNAVITVGEQDREHVLVQITRAGALVVRQDKDPRTGAWSIRFRLQARMRDGWESRLRQLGVWGDKHIPDVFLASGTSQREALLQGLMDTDGTINSRRGQATFCSTLRGLAEGVLFLARSLGWRATIREGRARLNGRDCGPKWNVSFTPKLSDPFRPFRLTRKLARVQMADGGKGRNTVSIASIERVPSVPVRCIKVDAPDGLFLAGRDLVATHNTAGIETPIVLTDLFVWDADRIAWTAHLFKTAREAFADHVQLIQSCPEFDRRVRKISYANGEEGIELVSGARLEYLARSKGGGRGLGGKRVVIDEALFFPAEAAGALLPILAARENPQIDYLSSAAKAESGQLRALTKRGRAGGDPSLIWVEWCAPGSFSEPGCADQRCQHAPGTTGCVLDDVGLLVQANPAMRAGRITREFLEAMRRTLPPLEFAREFLGWDEEAAEGEDTIPLQAWLARVDAGSAPAGRRVLAVDVAPDRGSSAIAGAGRRADGAGHAALVAHRAGVGWVVPQLVELRDRHDPLLVVLDGASQAASLLPDLAAAGFTVRSESNPHGLLHVMSAREMGQACGVLHGAVAGDEPWMWHRGDPILTAALTGAGRRDVGDGAWAWARKRSDVDICPLVAVTEAVWGLSTAPVAASGPLVAWR